MVATKMLVSKSDHFCSATHITYVFLQDTASLQFMESEYSVAEGNSVQVCLQLVLSGATTLGIAFNANLSDINGTFAGTQYSLSLMCPTLSHFISILLKRYCETVNCFLILGSEEDFSLDSTVVMFSVNDPSLVMDCINISTVQDQNYEGNHTFQVSITGINPATLPVATPSNVNVVIAENDGTYIFRSK